MKKILIVIGTLHIGGAENVAMNICRYIDKSKFECHYLLFDKEKGGYEDEAIKLGAKIIRISPPNEGYRKFYNNLIDLIQKNKYDVVHTHTLWNNGIVITAAKKCRVPVRISHSHSTKSRYKEGFIYKLYIRFMKYLIIKNSTDFLACGKDAGKYLFGEKIYRNKCKIMYNGIDIDKYRYNKETAKKIRTELGLNSSFVIGNVARLAVVKNQMFLIDIFEEILKKRSNSILLIIGDGEERNRLEKKIKEKSLQDKIKMLGIRNDVNELLQAMDIFVLPSLFEGFGIVLIEAQSASLYSLASDKVPKEAKQSDYLEFFELEKSAEEWADKILSAPDIYRSDNISSEIYKKFDIKNIIKDLEKIYEKEYYI